MSHSRTLLRKLDLDLIERLEAGGKQQKPQRSKSKKEPRPYFTYRQNYRGVASSNDPWAAPKSAFKHRPFTGRIRLNAKRDEYA